MFATTQFITLIFRKN